VVIEPPRNTRRGAILEVHDGVFVAGKIGFVEQRASTMHQPAILKLRRGVNALAIKSREQ
jgi:hypothetical protein